MRRWIHANSPSLYIPQVELIGQSGLSFKLDFILDTGAAYTMIPRDVALSIGYVPAFVKQIIPIATANGLIHAPLIFLKGVAIEDVRASQIAAACHDLPEIGFVGLLGLSFLRNFKTSIDFPFQTMSIE